MPKRNEDELVKISFAIFESLSGRLSSEVEKAIDISAYRLDEKEKAQVKKNILWMISVVYWPSRIKNDQNKL